MSQLQSPSAALGGAFELPLVVAESAARRGTLTQVPELFNTYALEVYQLGLLLPVDTPSALIEDALPCQLPNTPPWLHAMANWNGVVVPIFDLTALLALDAAETSTLRTLIIGQGDDAVGVLVANQPFRITLRSEEKLTRNPPLPRALQPFARAYYRTDRVWVDWDYRGFFDAVAHRF